MIQECSVLSNPKRYDMMDGLTVAKDCTRFTLQVRLENSAKAIKMINGAMPTRIGNVASLNECLTPTFGCCSRPRDAKPCSIFKVTARRSPP